MSDQQEVVAWEDPPDAGSGSGRRDPQVEVWAGVLKSRPGVWGRYPGNSWLRGRVHAGAAVRKLYPGLETRGRTLEGRIHLWGRWMGEETTGASEAGDGKR